MARVTWTDPALDSLKVLFEYIAVDSLVYAVRVVTHILNAPKKLSAFPLCGRVVPEFQDENIRELIYGSYRIIYQIRQDTCHVVAVIHGSRDILIHLKPGEWDVLYAWAFDFGLDYEDSHVRDSNIFHTRVLAVRSKR